MLGASIVTLLSTLDISISSTPKMATDIKPERDEPLRRPVVPYSPLHELSAPFLIDPSKRSYKHQYSNIYFVRLVELRPMVEAEAKRKWKKVRGRI